LLKLKPGTPVMPYVSHLFDTVDAPPSIEFPMSQFAAEL
jgi:hypothetical protein